MNTADRTKTFFGKDKGRARQREGDKGNSRLVIEIQRMLRMSNASQLELQQISHCSSRETGREGSKESQEFEDYKYHIRN